MAGKYNGTGVNLEKLEANLESLFCNLSHPVRGAQLLQSDRPKRMLAKTHANRAKRMSAANACCAMQLQLSAIAIIDHVHGL